MRWEEHQQLSDIAEQLEHPSHRQIDVLVVELPAQQVNQHQRKLLPSIAPPPPSRFRTSIG
jgi:hypothetical protein